jgi:hypothetical protein
VIAGDDGEFGGLKGGVALAPGPALKRLGWLLQPMFLIRIDLVLRGWWISRLANASWLEVSSGPKTRPVLFFFSGNGEGPVCLVVAAMVVCSITTLYILLVLCCLYPYQHCIVMFTKEVIHIYLRAYIIKKKSYRFLNFVYLKCMNGRGKSLV